MVQLQADNPNLRFTYPDEGAVLWTDNMMLPAKVQHPFAAETFMKYVYEPEVAASIAAYVSYMPPVQGARGIIAKPEPALAGNPLVCPPPEQEKKIRPYAQFSCPPRQEPDKAFAKV